MKSYHIILFLTLLLTGCQSLPENPEKSDALPRIVPDYIGTNIPDGIAPLNFYVDEEDVEQTDVTIKGWKGNVLHSNGADAQFDVEEWHRLIHQHVGDSLRVTVCVKRNGTWTEYKSFPIYVSKDPLGEWGVTYRLIPPGYETWGLMGLYQRDLSNFEQTPIVENKHIDTNCMNCHTPNRTDPSQFTFHIRGSHGATVVGNKQQTEMLTPRHEALGGSMVYPFWHPSGKFIAYSTNQTHQNFHQLNDRRVEVYDDKSDIIIYQPSSHTILLDSVTATKEHLENFPAFSPDGKTLYYCAANRVDSIQKQYKDIKYNICRIGFNPDTGELIGQVDTLINARMLGKSANMPRVSYDGRFLLYTLSDYGCFPIWHPEADLWMMNLENGDNHPLTAANSQDAESFHNWSLNSRWIVFTSRRDDGLYTQLYLAHIDANGKASKPFRLPQENPREYDVETIYSFNTPEFAKMPIDLQQQNIYQRLKDAQRQETILKVRTK